MPLQATSGAASYDAFGGGVAAVPNYIEDVFQTWLYTGNGSTQTITNGIDLAGKGGLVWFKPRDTGNNHNLIDSARGLNKFLITNDTNAEGTTGSGFGVASFNSNGFSLNPPWTSSTNTTGTNYVSWTFREQAKFFDVVTYTGNGTAGRTVAHNLGSVPGCMIVKRLDSATLWRVYHRSLGATQNLKLNDTAAAATESIIWNDTAPTSTEFTLGNNTNVNGSGSTYVAYLFAHNAGGFGLSGTDNVISCGSFTTNGSGVATVDLGYEPQWILTKTSSDVQSWYLQDNMRGYPARPGNSEYLTANTSDAETFVLNGGLTFPTATGFVFNQNISVFNNKTFIYIAIRRGPMKTPTSGTSVFATQGSTAPSPPSWHSTNFPVDLGFWKNKTNASGDWNWGDRLRGGSVLNSNNTNAEVANTQYAFDYQEGWYNGSALGDNYPSWMFRRAPGFFDEVCYTGNQTARTINHNLGVVPELMIMKNRSSADTGWITALTVGGLSWTSGNFLRIELTNGTLTNTAVLNTTPTATVFSIPSGNTLNNLADNYVAYLFASAPGVSKVTNFTGTGTLQTINCGFTGGARFVLIKRTDSTGNWFVWDSSRGLSSSNDPYLMLNSTAAEVTSTNWVDTTATGFQVTAASGNDVNINGASYIALAIS